MAAEKEVKPWKWLELYAGIGGMKSAATGEYIYCLLM